MYGTDQHGFGSLLIYLGTGATPERAGVGRQMHGRREVRVREAGGSGPLSHPTTFITHLTG